MNVKDGRLPKQLGDFGESLVAFLLGNIKGHRVAIVDHEGADIIATDRLDSKLRYAISVKSRRFKKDDASIVFDLYNQNKLRTFAREFDMIPVVAFVLIDGECQCCDVYILKLDDFKQLADDSEFCGIGNRSEGLTILNTTTKNKNNIQNSEKIDYTKLEFSNLTTDFFGKKGTL